MPYRTLERHVAVRRPLRGNPGAPPLHVMTPHQVSPLDLPPAFVYRVCDVQADGQAVISWITDPVALSRYCRTHPQAEISVMSTDHMPRRPPAH